MAASTESRRHASPAGIVVFASGAGSNLRALADAVRDGRLPAVIKALVTNVPGAGVVDVAREFAIPVVEVQSRGLDRGAHEAQVLERLRASVGDLSTIDWIVLAGYMRLFTPEFVRTFTDAARGVSRIVNIHPSLLPSFPGVGAYGQAVRHGVKVTGATVHLVTEGLDDGPIVAQAPLEVGERDDEATLSRRGLALEHSLYPRALGRLISEPWTIRSGSVGAPVEANGRPRVVFEENAG